MIDQSLHFFKAPTPVSPETSMTERTACDQSAAASALWGSAALDSAMRQLERRGPLIRIGLMAES